MLVSVFRSTVKITDARPLAIINVAGMMKSLSVHSNPEIIVITGKINENMYSLCFNSMCPFLCDNLCNIFSIRS